MPTSRLSILKTYKLFIGGKFPRTESGRTMTATNPKTGKQIANYCHASRKDLRNAVVAARKAQTGWGNCSAYLRGQILYRLAEMLESRSSAFVEEIAQNTGKTRAQARKEVETAVDRLVYFAGWTDKFPQVFGAINPVASSHFNFTIPEPTGVVGIFAPDSPSLLGLISVLSTAILSGNTVVILASESEPLSAVSFAEAIATSDFPAGVINILTGNRKELAPWMAGHKDVNAVIDASGDRRILKEIQEGQAINMKRVSDHSCKNESDWFGEKGKDPYRILDTLENKTVWHPIGV